MYCECKRAASKFPCVTHTDATQMYLGLTELLSGYTVYTVTHTHYKCLFVCTHTVKCLNINFVITFLLLSNILIKPGFVIVNDLIL